MSEQLDAAEALSMHKRESEREAEFFIPHYTGGGRRRGTEEGREGGRERGWGVHLVQLRMKFPPVSVRCCCGDV